MKTLHFFTEYYQPECNSTSFFVTKIIHACAKTWNGALRVYCATDNPGEEELVGDSVKIYRFKGGGINKNSLIARLLKFVLITMKFSWAALFKVRKGDTVFAVTNPAFMLVFLAFLRKIRSFRFVLLVYDIFPEVLIPGGLASVDSFKYKISLRIFNWAYNSADTLLVIGRDMQEVVARKVKDASKVVFIPNWSDTESIAPLSKEGNPILKRLGIEGKIIFSVAGNMGRTQGLDNIIKALSLNCLDDDAVFLFMGGGAKLQSVQADIEARGLKNVKITGWIPQEEQNAMLNACDVAVVSLAEGMYGLSVPSKSYFNIAAGKPLLLIADSQSEIARMIRENNIGWIVRPNQPQELADTLSAIQKITADELKDYSTHARYVAEAFYREENILKRYQNNICNM